MQLLLVHSDFLEYEVKKKLGVGRVVLYPYAHLSSDLSSHDVAVSVLKGLETGLDSDFEVMRAPFGWYKGFTLKCKGHPLSELSRTIRPSSDVGCEVVSEAVLAEERAESSWYLLSPDGELVELDRFDFTGHANLRVFADYEVSKSRAVDRMPPHVELMRRLEIADYEPASDQGNMRFYPKGRLLKGLLEEYVCDVALGAGAMEVETPLMYDMNHPTLKKYLDRFPARQYSIESDKRSFFLRFSACFGQFLMNHDMTISYRSLPLKMFELTRYSFRKEQSGELVGLRRLRAFTMPDMHTLCSDMNEAIHEFYAQYKMCIRLMETIGLKIDDYEVAVRFTRDFYEDNREFLVKLVETVKKPVLVEVWDERFFYFVLKFEFNYIDCLGKASALSTVQIDVENAERYDIGYIDEGGETRRPIILHCSPSGAIERCIYALLEKAQKATDSGELPVLPFWLSPTQVRVIPVADRHREYAESVAARLSCRVDIDDRDASVGRKIRDAGREWIPYVVVVGDSEVEGQTLTVTVREESTPKKPKKVVMSVEELEEIIKDRMKGRPYKPLPLNTFVSLRPKFV
ncbi:threonine--tRNA ligase [Methanosarcinales archaeon ex4484_138]|nr:MAG: threonine--tRNA ligase [Methanosarcinales archaeon ex4484_138]